MDWPTRSLAVGQARLCPIIQTQSLLIMEHLHVLRRQRTQIRECKQMHARGAEVDEGRKPDKPVGDESPKENARPAREITLPSFEDLREVEVGG